MAEVEYKPNSHKAKEKAKEKKDETTKQDTRAKLLANRKNEPKKPENRSVASIILGDLGMILTELKDDVIIPGVIDLGKDMWEDMGDRLYETISGRPGSSRTKRKHKKSYHAYDGDYKGGSSKKNRNGKKPKKINYGRYSMYEVPIETEALAEDVIDAIFEQFDDAGFCSVKDYYDFADFNDWQYTDYPGDWGWDMEDEDDYPFDPDDLEIERITVNGERMYTITGFPKPIRLD